MGEKYDNVIQILWNCYDGKNENLRIESSVLMKYDVGVDEFRVICGRLQREGILSENPFNVFLPYDGDVIDGFTFNRLFNERDRILSSIADAPHSQLSSVDTRWTRIEEINQKMDALDRIFKLLIDGEKLEAVYKKNSGSDDEDQSHKKTITEDAVGVKSKMKFDSQNGVLRYGDVTHAFHKGQRGEEIRILFFRQLWDDRRLIKKGVEKISGTLRTPAYFAVQINLVSDVSTFARNKKVKDKLSGFIKGINKTLKQKGFPALIERKGGVQLIVNEK